MRHIYGAFFVFICLSITACGGGSVQDQMLISGVIQSRSNNEIVVHDKSFKIGNAKISAYGQDLTVDTLKAGLRVMLDGHIAGQGPGTLSYIKLANVVVGTISQIVDDQTFVVLGQTVQVTSHTRFSGLLAHESLSVGTEVIVNGVANYDGSVFADYITLLDRNSESQGIMGIVHTVDRINKKLTIGQLIVDFSSSDLVLNGEIQATNWVEISGRFDMLGKKLVAKQIITHAAKENLDQKIEISGVVFTGAVADIFEINGSVARIHENTSFKGGTKQSLVNLQQALVRGTMSDQGVLEVDHVEVFSPVEKSAQIRTARRWQVEEETQAALKEAEASEFTSRIEGPTRWVDTDINEILLVGFTTQFFYTNDSRITGALSDRFIGVGSHIAVETSIESGERIISSIELIRTESPDNVIVTGHVEAFSQEYIVIAGSKIYFEGSELAQQEIDDFLSIVDIGSFARLEGKVLSGNRVRWQSLSVGTTE